MKVSELTGRALDWAVCMALGNTPVRNPHRFGSISYGIFESELGYAVKNYSSDPSYAHPIIDLEKIAIIPIGDEWVCVEYRSGVKMSGSTSLIAAMRCFVASRLGTEVDIPEELKCV